MQEVFEKIIEKLELKSYWTQSTFDEDGYSNDDSEEVIELYDAIEIVKQTEEEYKGGWIPCSERSPEVTGGYLVTVHPNYIVPGGIHVDMLSWFNGKWWFDLDGQDVEFPDPIIAWMPMPEPYKGGEEHE